MYITGNFVTDIMLEAVLKLVYCMFITGNFVTDIILEAVLRKDYCGWRPL